MAPQTFESLDYLYVPAPDFEAAVRFYTVTIGGELAGAFTTAACGWRRCGSPASDHLCCWRVIWSRTQLLIIGCAVSKTCAGVLPTRDGRMSNRHSRSRRDHASCSAIPAGSGSRSTNACGRGSTRSSRDASTRSDVGENASTNVAAASHAVDGAMRNRWLSWRSYRRLLHRRRIAATRQSSNAGQYAGTWADLGRRRLRASSR